MTLKCKAAKKATTARFKPPLSLLLTTVRPKEATDAQLAFTALQTALGLFRVELALTTLDSRKQVVQLAQLVMLESIVDKRDSLSLRETVQVVTSVKQEAPLQLQALAFARQVMLVLQVP